MDIEGLRSFVAVARHGNFTRAAEELYVTQPTLSRRISRLETELGAPLFERERGGVALSAAGKSLLREAEAIVARVDAMPALLADTSVQGEPVESTLTGSLHVAAQDMLDEALVHLFLSTMMGRHPALSMQLKRAYPPELRQQLAHGSCDVALFLRPVASSTSQLLTRKIGESRVQLMVYEGHPFARRGLVDIHELMGEPVIMLDRRVSPEIVDFIISRCVGAGFSLNSVRYVSDIENAAVLVSAARGISFVHSMMRFPQPLETVGVRVVDIVGVDMSIDYVARLRNDLADDLRDAILNVLDEMALGV